MALARSHFVSALFTLALSLAVAGCGSMVKQGEGSITTTLSTSTTVPGAVVSAQVPLPRSVETNEPGYIPYPARTAQAIWPALTLTPIPTIDSVAAREPHGDSPEADAILRRWQEAFEGMRSVRGSQRFFLVEADGTRRDPSTSAFREIEWTDEWYARLDTRDASTVRYRFVAHIGALDVTTLYDGAGGAYRVWGWLPEVYRPWPDSFAPNAYWADIDDDAMLHFLRPVASQYTTYSLVGRAEVDGRKVIELLVKQGNALPHGRTGTRISLDEATYLPYRYIVPRNNPRMGDVTGYERVFNQLEVNGQLSDADFTPPLPTNAVTVYESAYRAPKMPVYSSMQEAQKAAGYALFELQDWAPGEIETKFLVEKDGTLTPVLSLSLIEGITWKATILQGVYVPALSDNERFGLIFTGKMEIGMQPVSVNIDGLPAEWRTFPDSEPYLKLEREGTQITIRTRTKEEAIEIAQRLRRVK